MKKSEFPETIEYRHEYTAFYIAVLLKVAHRTACRLIDSGEIPARRSPVGRKERLVSHATIAMLSRKGGRFGGLLSKITNIPPGQ